MRSHGKAPQQQRQQQTAQGGAVPDSNAPPTKPFLSQDVFRLVVRLEAQKLLGDVDVGALERKFRVPLGYSEEDTHRKQEALELNNLPGPGAYEVENPWRLDGSLAHQSAIFASRTDRDPFQLTTLVRSSPASLPPSRGSSSSKIPNESPSPTHSPSPVPLGSFSRSARGLESGDKSSRRRARTGGHSQQQQQQQAPSSPLNTSEHGALGDSAAPRVLRSLLSSQSAVFPRASKEKESLVRATDPDLGPGRYDVRRLWDARSPSPDQDQQYSPCDRAASTANQSDAPTFAAFGASREKRELMWSPARNPPSCAIPEAWNASPHYAKQKSRVLHAVERAKLQQQKQKQQQRKSKKHGLEGSTHSSPGLSSLKHANRFPAGTSSGSSIDSLDPFEWLRGQPQGEHRVNLLATKHGLLEQVRALQHHTHQHAEEVQSGDANAAETNKRRPVLAHQGSQQDLPQHQQPHSRDQNPESSHEQQQQQQQDSTRYQEEVPPHVIEKDERIVVSCRLPGGLMLSATLFSRKRVRHLKAQIVQKSHRRFTSEEQFELFLPNGRRLGHAEDTLHTCGLTTRSLVQIVPVPVPAAAAAATPSTR